MESKTHYSATMPTVPFAFNETRLIARMMLDGMDRKEIKNAIHVDNLFNVKTLANENKIFNYTYNRLEICHDKLKTYILSDDLTDAQFANLISVMQYDVLFREFVFDVYATSRERNSPITNYDIMTFFEKKAMESETVAGWKHDTVFKLRRLYTRILYEAGLLKTSSGEREIVTPFVSQNILAFLINQGFYDYLEATVGHT